ncbi:MFS transporter [Parapedobacter deserti]|uniref:MFS transporter n=1 Tax=Parapedobacter deserti TaxID=1912957 RepID=A0ABV7JTP0_9SPHI
MKGNRKWWMLAFAFTATVINYVDRLAFNYLSAEGPLREIISDEVFGYIGTTFFVAYTCSNLFSGWMIDRLKTKLGYLLSMAVWTTATLLHAFAKTPIQFGAFRFLLGIGEAGNWPAAVRLIAEWFPPSQRSTASGIFNSGSAFGAIIAPIVIGWLVMHLSWNYIFVLLGGVGYLWMVLFWYTYHAPPIDAAAEQPKNIPLKVLFNNRFVFFFTISKFFIDPVWYFITFWIGRYLVDVHQLDFAQMAWLAMIPFVMADVGNIFGGVFTQFMISKVGLPVARARKIAVVVFGVLLVGSLIAAPLLITSPLMAIALLGMSAFANTAYTANSLAFPADVVPTHATASVWGIASVGAGLGGACFQALSGISVASLAARFDYTIAYHTIFIGYGLLASVGFCIVLFLMGPLQKDPLLEKWGISPPE